MNRLKTSVLSQTIRFFFISCLLLFAGTTISIDAKIVFCVDGDIFVMNDDGSSRRRLTKNTQSRDSHPRWAPDGTKIAFNRDIDERKAEVFIMNADGTDPQRLTDNIVFDGYASWSPDGQRLAFTSSRGGNNRNKRDDVFVIELASRTVTQLTGAEDDVGSVAPDWSPDGRRITFERFIPIKNGMHPKTIYVMDAGGQHQHPILPDPASNGPPTFRFFPRWSADGQHILFYEAKWFRDGDVKRFIVQRIGGRTQEITDVNDRLDDNFLIAGVSWMEKDRAMLFSIKRWDKSHPNYNLYRYGLKTRDLKRLTSADSDEMWPD